MSGRASRERRRARTSIPAPLREKYAALGKIAERRAGSLTIGSR